MYQSPVSTHGFNHQSFYRQPVSNLRQINEIVWNRTNEIQQSHTVPQRANMDKHIYSSLEEAMKHQSELRKEPKLKNDNLSRECI